MIEYGANVSAKQRMEAQKKYPGIQFSKGDQQQGQTAQKQGAAGQATPNFGSQQQTGGFPSVPQQGQQSAPDMSVYAPRSSGGQQYAPSPAPSGPRMSAGQASKFNERYGFPQGFGVNTPLAYSTAPSPPPQTVNGLPVATEDPNKYQRQIDEMQQRGTWDDPRNAKARERLEQKLADANRAPPGYFVTPDGRLEPNYTYSLYGAPQQSSPTIPTMTPDQRNAVSQQFGMNPSDVGQLYAPAQQPPIPMPAVPNTASGGLQNQLAMRDAFIASINNSLMQQQLANGLNARGAMPPQFNFPALYQQAGQMVANGWSNPLAALLG